MNRLEEIVHIKGLIKKATVRFASRDPRGAIFRRPVITMT